MVRRASVIDADISKAAPEAREQLRQICAVARKAVPEVEEVLSYRMPRRAHGAHNMADFCEIHGGSRVPWLVQNAA